MKTVHVKGTMPDWFDKKLCKEKAKASQVCQVCSICHKIYVGHGNNAYPFDGRCCDRCDEEHVQPHRVLLCNWKDIPKKEQQ